MSRKNTPSLGLDFYPTPAWCVDIVIPEVMKELARTVTLRKTHKDFLGCIFEPGTGDGVILERVANAVRVFGYDHFTGVELNEAAAIDCTMRGMEVVAGDYLSTDPPSSSIDLVIMNPPYGGSRNTAQMFIDKAMREVCYGGAVFVLLRSSWLLDGGKRHGRMKWLKNVVGLPTKVFGLTKRPSFTGNGKTDGATYCWMMWRKGNFPSHIEYHILEVP